jgi:homoserine kinase
VARAGASPWVVGSRCQVRVPATSANLGPGFDSLGLALGLYDVLEVEIRPDGLEVTVAGEGAGHVPLDHEHLVVRTIHAAAQHWDLPPPPGLRLHAHNAIPHGRGLGSSAAAIVAALVVTDLLAPRRQLTEGTDRPERDLLGLAASFEGHPDNVAAALLGGLTIAWCEPDAARGVRLQPHRLIEPVLLVPQNRLETKAARAVLPVDVTHSDAARTAGRAALLIHALTSEPDLLMPATEDWLHQKPRAAAMPESLDLMDRLRADGCAAVISGAGPSVLVLCVGAEDGGIGTQAGELTQHPPQGWLALAPGISHQGTRGGLIGSGSPAAPSVLL